MNSVLHQTAQAYVDATLAFINNQHLPVNATIAKLLNRPNPVRIGKIANFTISNRKLTDLFSNEEIYAISNIAYNKFNRIIEPDPSGIDNPELLAAIQAR